MSSLYEDLEELLEQWDTIANTNEKMLEEADLRREELISIQGFKEATEWRAKELAELLEKHNPDRLGVHINQNWEKP